MVLLKTSVDCICTMQMQSLKVKNKIGRVNSTVFSLCVIRRHATDQSKKKRKIPNSHCKFFFYTALDYKFKSSQ